MRLKLFPEKNLNGINISEDLNFNFPGIFTGSLQTRKEELCDFICRAEKDLKLQNVKQYIRS